MPQLQRTIRSFAAGTVSIDELQFAAEQTPGEVANNVLVLLLEYENSGPEFDEIELRRRAIKMLEAD
jgi:hypothetical protein